MKKNSPVNDRHLVGAAASPFHHLAEAELPVLGGLNALVGCHRPHPPATVGVDVQACHPWRGVPACGREKCGDGP